MPVPIILAAKGERLNPKAIIAAKVELRPVKILLNEAPLRGAGFYV
jgi:hypothetical protein